jgi:hypothetical protein
LRGHAQECTPPFDGLAREAGDRRDVTNEIEAQLVIERRIDRVRRSDQEKRIARRRAALSPVRIAIAQTYPTRSVHWIVGAPPGAAADINARLIGQWLSERLGKPFLIENRPAARE